MIHRFLDAVNAEGTPAIKLIITRLFKLFFFLLLELAATRFEYLLFLAIHVLKCFCLFYSLLFAPLLLQILEMRVRYFLQNNVIRIGLTTAIPIIDRMLRHDLLILIADACRATSTIVDVHFLRIHFGNFVSLFNELLLNS